MKEAPSLAQQDATAIKRASMEAEVRQNLSRYFDENPDGKSRVHEILSQSEPVIRHIPASALSDNTKKNIIQTIKNCEPIEDKNTFIARAMEAYEPLFELKIHKLGAFEEAINAYNNEKRGWTPLNRLISYEKDGSTIRLHHGQGTTVENKWEQYMDALKQLAVIVEQDPKITTIIGTSWIVDRMQTTFRRAGFTVEDVDEKIRHEHFNDGMRAIKKATMTREELLARYLNKN